MNETKKGFLTGSGIQKFGFGILHSSNKLEFLDRKNDRREIRCQLIERRFM